MIGLHTSYCSVHFHKPWIEVGSFQGRWFRSQSWWLHPLQHLCRWELWLGQHSKLLATRALSRQRFSVQERLCMYLESVALFNKQIRCEIWCMRLKTKPQKDDIGKMRNYWQECSAGNQDWHSCWILQGPLFLLRLGKYWLFERQLYLQWARAISTVWVNSIIFVGDDQCKCCKKAKSRATFLMDW